MFKDVFRTLSSLLEKINNIFHFSKPLLQGGKLRKTLQTKYFVEIPLRIRCLESSDLPASCRALSTNFCGSVIAKVLCTGAIFSFLNESLKVQK